MSDARRIGLAQRLVKQRAVSLEELMAHQNVASPIFMENRIKHEHDVVEHVDIKLLSNSMYSFDTLKSDLSYLQLDDWEVVCTETNVHIYKLMVEPSGNLKIQTSIMVDSNLILKVFHRDKAIGLKFSNKTIHRSIKLKEWSHLQKLIDKFSNVQELKIRAAKVRYEL